MVDEHASDWGVATSETLGDGLDVWYNTFVFPRMQSAAAAHARHDLCSGVSVC